MFGIPSNSSKKVNLTKRTSTLTVNPNGGTWNNSTVPQAFSQAPTSTKTISSAPSKTGNSFEGWTKSDGGSWDESTLTYTFDSSDGTLTAGWLANSYILTTVASPLDAGTVTAGGTLDYDSTKTLTATPENITGYTTAFLNWTLSGPGSLTSTTTNPTTFKTGAGNATVTATFTKTANAYTVKFNGNGADSGSMANQSFVYDEAAKPLSANQFIKNNYNFIGWNTKADGTGVSYEPEQSVQNLAPSGVLNLYAVWQLAGFAIQYNANGHGTPPASQIKVVGQNLTLQPYMPDQEETSPRKVYTITGDANGGTWEGSNGVATSLLHHLYSQYQWNTKSNGTGIIYESQAVYTADSALSLYAIWNDDETREYTYMVPTGTPSFSQTLTVTFDANTGDFEGAATSTAYGSRNCEFEGWYTDPSGGVVRDSSSQVLASETVYAHYVDSPFSSIFTPASCSKTGFELLGWAKNSNSTVPDYAPGIEIQLTSSDVTVVSDSWIDSSPSNFITYDISSWSSDLNSENYFRMSGKIGVVQDNQQIWRNISSEFYWVWSEGQIRTYSFSDLNITLTLTPTTVSLAGDSDELLVDLNFSIDPYQYLYAVWGQKGEVYIGGEKYRILIYDGANWGQYQAYIAEGSRWIPY